MKLSASHSTRNGSPASAIVSTTPGRAHPPRAIAGLRDAQAILHNRLIY